MWIRKDLKGKAKEALKRNYWKAVLVSLFLIILSGGIGSGSSWRNDSNSNHVSYKNMEKYYNVNGEKGLLRDNGFVQEFDKIDQFAVAAVVLIVIVAIVIILIVVAVALAIDAFLINPLVVGIRRFFVQDLDHKAVVGEITYAFDHNYKNIVITMFLKNLFVFLWSLLLIVPGIIKAYEYRMIVYIMAENPQMDRSAAFALSKEMMTGQKWNAFVLDLSFLGWNILGMLTMGILSIFYVSPYQYHTNAALYNALKGESNNIAIQ